MILSALAILFSGDICTALTARQPVDDVVLEGTVGTEFRHGWTWIGGFGCGERNIMLSIPDASVRESEGGRELVDALDRTAGEMVSQGDLGVRYDIGLRVRLAGSLTWDAEGVRPTLRVKAVDILEAGQ